MRVQHACFPGMTERSTGWFATVTVGMPEVFDDLYNGRETTQNITLSFGPASNKSLRRLGRFSSPLPSLPGWDARPSVALYRGRQRIFNKGTFRSTEDLSREKQRIN